MKFDGILLDLDGTLWDSSEGVVIGFNRMLSRHPGLREPVTREEIAGIMGVQAPQAAKKLFPGLPEKEGLAMLTECFQDEIAALSQGGSTLYPGVRETLEKLSGRCFLGIVSNCQEGYIPCFFAAHSLEPFFSDYEYSGRTRLLKGENIRLVMERNGLKNPVYVGDTQLDADAARLAGIPFVFAAYGFGRADHADYTIRSFSELPAIAE